MRPLTCLTLILMWPYCYSLAQSATIPGIVEPPELSGPPVKVVEQPSETLKALVAAMPSNFNDPAQVRATKALVDKLIEDHPDFAEGFSIRVMLGCALNQKDYSAIIQDIDAALKYQQSGEKGVFNTPSSLFS